MNEKMKADAILARHFKREEHLRLFLAFSLGTVLALMLVAL